MTRSGFYRADPSDPDAPVRLDEHEGMRPGDTVEYRNPALAFGLTAPMKLLELWRFAQVPGDDEPEHTQAIVDVQGEDSPYEINADNLRKVAARVAPRPSIGGARPCTARTCGAWIIDVVTVPGGRRSVVDARSDPDGTVAITLGSGGRWGARTLRPGVALMPGEVRVMSHWATCTEPGKFRKRAT